MSTKTELRLIRQWEERMVEDYYEYRCQMLLEPLYEDFQQWKLGEFSHETLFDTVQRVNRENRERVNFFARNREDLSRLIQQDPWFVQWLQAHPAPEGVEIDAAGQIDDPGSPPAGSGPAADSTGENQNSAR